MTNLDIPIMTCLYSPHDLMKPVEEFCDLSGWPTYLSPLHDLVKSVGGFMTDWMDQMKPNLLWSDSMKSVGGLRINGQVFSIN